MAAASRQQRPASSARRWWLAACCGLLAGLAQAADDAAARQWLDRMAVAVNNLSYEGTLVYRRGNQLEAMRIYHRVDDGVIRERLVSLSGPHREVLRDDQTVRCIFPDRHSVLVDTRITEPWYPIIPAEQAVDPSTRYDFRILDEERIAGMTAVQLHVRPKDGYRYGYRLWLERNTGMLLKSELLGADGRPLEQLMFTDVTIGGTITDSDLTPDVAQDGFVQVEFPRAEPTAPGTVDLARWEVGELPEGFMLSSHRHSEHNGTLEHLVYTDGLASVSVYVEPASKAERPLRGAGQMGPINMFGTERQGFAVTAVGEVPSDTVRVIATSVRRSE